MNYCNKGSCYFCGSLDIVGDVELNRTVVSYCRDCTIEAINEESCCAQALDEEARDKAEQDRYDRYR